MTSFNVENASAVEEYFRVCFSQLLICNIIQKVIPANSDSKDHLTTLPAINSET